MTDKSKSKSATVGHYFKKTTSLYTYPTWKEADEATYQELSPLAVKLVKIETPDDIDHAEGYEGYELVVITTRHGEASPRTGNWATAPISEQNRNGLAKELSLRGQFEEWIFLAEEYTNE
jgi:hypothetical protein